MMKKLGWYTNEVTDEFICESSPTMRVKLVFKKGHLYLEWPSIIILFSRSDLSRLRSRFANPPSTKLAELLKHARPDEYSSQIKKMLDDISSRCKPCQHMSPIPYTFQVTMPDGIQFNNEIILDLAWIEPRPHHPVLHAVDRGTHFSATNLSHKKVQRMYGIHSYHAGFIYM